MRFDPDGYPVREYNAPTTWLGKTAAVIGAVVCLGIFAYGFIAIAGDILHATGLLP